MGGRHSSANGGGLKQGARVAKFGSLGFAIEGIRVTGDWWCKYAKVGTPTFEQLWRQVASGRIFGFLEQARETRFPVTKITSFVTPGWLALHKPRHFRATGVPKTSEFAP
jgi:hypothetical protein